MKIKEFKKGDYIHRTKPFHANYGMQNSLIDEPMEFLEVKSGLIFYKEIEEDIPSDQGKIRRTPLYDKNDNNWDYYPTEYINRPRKPILRSELAR